ncbi:hypothetical protein Pst134EB_029508 [Puccinia striiformis f. sp. tritici]|nr:hypothetical protein Pst134EB_029508 [Puccinia striiformis f. sp. tritici]
MSTIPSTQPTQNDLQQTPNTAREGATQATTPEATQPATQWDKVEAMAVGVEIVEPTVDKQHVVWLINPVNKVLEVLTVLEGRYDLWRNSAVSKREIAETINEYLIENGGESCAWKGIEQQMTNLEKKFRQALAYQDQTGQGILDKADELARQAGGNPDNSDTDDFVGNAIAQTQAHICKICRYFYELEPVMLDCPSAVPLYIHEQGNVDGNLAGALNLGPNEDRPTNNQTSFKQNGDSKSQAFEAVKRKHTS